MSKYNVLWLDDQFDSPELQEIADKADDKFSITLNGFESAEEGIEELEKLETGQIHYDAVLLDARFHKKRGGTTGTEDLKGLSHVWNKLNQLEGKGIILPRFILSGQTDLSSSGIFKETYGEFYSKHEPDDINKLLNDICEAADKRIETQIRHQNEEIFTIFTNGYLSSVVENQVMEQLKSTLPSNKAELKALLVNIRSIQEECFIQLESIRVIPNSNDTFNNINKLLSGNKSYSSGYKATSKEYQNDSIENLQRWIYNTCGMYIHALKIGTYVDYMISNYAVESLKFGILEILLWFKKTYEENK
jgi:hypothetical protein